MSTAPLAARADGPLGQVDLRVGTILAARPNPAARGPAVVLEIDLGPELGQRRSSAALARDYAPETLVGRQVVCACHLAPKRVAGVVSEVLVLAALAAEGLALLAPDRLVAAGSRIA